MKVLLIRSPRYYWPFINEYDNFLLPQSLPCLAAALRANNIEVRAVDCMPLKMGWKSLYSLIKEENPDVVGVGDSESLYSHEAANALKITKEINPNIATVAGGAHFSNLPEESMKNYPIDFIVRGEGEETLAELVKELDDSRRDFRRVRGIIFKNGDDIIETEPRPLIENLDDLPFPAYDMMPMSEYGKAKFLFSPGCITIHHSRGCISNCKFCVWWVQMAERKVENGTITLQPRWRTKSVNRVIEEIRLLVNKYNKRYLVFTDDAWNVNPEWSSDFAEQILKSKIKIKWFAFMRADFILRDEKLGIFEKLVKAGLTHISIGVERNNNEDLSSFGKNCYSVDRVYQCMHLLKNKYPQVFRQVTFIVGTRNETKTSILQQLEYARKISADYPAFHPLTPVPGTELWETAKKNKWLEITDFSYYDWTTPVMSSDHLSRQEIENFIYILHKKYANLTWLLKGLLNPYPYKRDMYIWWVLVVFRMFCDSVLHFINPFKFKEYVRLIKPKWYDD